MLQIQNKQMQEFMTKLVCMSNIKWHNELSRNNRLNLVQGSQNKELGKKSSITHSPFSKGIRLYSMLKFPGLTI